MSDNITPADRLQEERSLMLRSFASSPVDWYPWGDEALARARAEDKPILLGIGYAASHACRLMRDEVFADEQIATMLNEHFICIQVDRHARPDVDEVYLDALRLITGQAGWPVTAFLTPAAAPFFAGTLFPPEAFRELLAFLARIC